MFFSCIQRILIHLYPYKKDHLPVQNQVNLYSCTNIASLTPSIYPVLWRMYHHDDNITINAGIIASKCEIVLTIFALMRTYAVIIGK